MEKSSLKILLYNLRDIKNPNHGGAEVFTHEIAKRWVHQGHKVTLFVSNFETGSENEIVDDVQIIRKGNMYSVFGAARKYYKDNLINRYDIIIDEYTFKPFLTPKFLKEPIIFLAHELAREKYFYELPPILSHICYYYLEPSWLNIYKNIDTVTVSNSTRSDLFKIGYKKIHIVPEGINFDPIDKITNKEDKPTLLFVGLLKKSNLVDHAIEAFRKISKKIPDAKLWIVGRGPELDHLRRISRGLNVDFLGYVSEEKKLEVMQRAHVLIVPAIREGWGLVVTEANACGTPAVGYNVNGLRDSICDGKTGILTEENTPESLAKSVLWLLENNETRSKLSENALEWSRHFSWENTSTEFINIAYGVLNDWN